MIEINRQTRQDHEEPTCARVCILPVGLWDITRRPGGREEYTFA